MATIARSGPLTLAQQRMWLRSYWRGRGELFPGWSKLWEMPPGISVEAATRALGQLVERHEILRTQFAFAPDGSPVQVVFEPDGLRPPLSVMPMDAVATFRPADGRPLLAGQDFRGALWAARFFTEDDELRTFGLVFDHIISDGSGLYNWRTQFTDLCFERDAARPPKQPLDHQRAEAAVVAASASRGRVRATPVRPAPQVPAPGPPKPETGPRYLTATAKYEGLLAVIDEICREANVSRSMVLMYAIGWLWSTHADNPDLLFAMHVANRTARDHGVECRMQLADIQLAFDDSRTFRQELDSVCAISMRAYEDTYRLGPVSPGSRAQTTAERGVGAIVPLYFNFQGPPGPGEAGSDDVKGTVTADRSHAWDHYGRPWGTVAWIYIQDEKVILDLDTDIVMVPEQAADAMLDVLPELLRLMRDEPDTAASRARSLLPEGFEAVTNCRLVAGNWVDPQVTERILRDAPGVLAASVLAEADELSASVELAPGAAMFDVHEYVLSQLHHNLTAAAPSVYRVEPKNAESGASDLWHPATDTPVIAPATDAERELRAALSEIHGRDFPDLARSYIQSGGEMLLAPAVVEVLCRRGLTGLDSHHFTSPCTLRAVARALRTPPPPTSDGASY